MRRTIEFKIVPNNDLHSLKIVQAAGTGSMHFVATADVVDDSGSVTLEDTTNPPPVPVSFDFSDDDVLTFE